MKKNEKKENGVLVAKIMEKMARKSAKASADSLCAFIYHQPKMPKGINDL